MTAQANWTHHVIIEPVIAGAVCRTVSRRVRTVYAVCLARYALITFVVAPLAIFFAHIYKIRQAGAVRQCYIRLSVLALTLKAEIRCILADSAFGGAFHTLICCFI